MSAPNTKNNDGAGGGGGGDADSFSSDSDDEFLTIREDGKGNVDREALVRKKLLESFYGKAAVQEDNNDDSSDDDSSSSGRKPPSRSASHDTYDDGSDEENTKKRRSRKVDPIAAADLDSADFDATKHTEAYVLHSGVHPLLETEESLACQVRTLDSSMQTLVYENYSRFIEATDAIRSIGVNVHANSSNLQKLSTSMETVGETARRVESSCGALRDSVVEKLRVKRLLQRLDALLKLPSTLRENIDAGRYRWASKSYLTAYNILSKHSAGFESLQRIEIECYDIMESLLVDVRRKLLHWSGKLILDDDDDLDGDDDCEDDQGENLRTKQSALLEDPPDPPQSVAEIFECAGTAVLMLMNQRQKQEDGITDSIATTEVLDRPATITRMASRVEFDPGLTLEECKDMALSACLRLLERHLDTHHIELQDAMFATDGATGLGASGKSNGLLDTAQLAVPSLQSTQTPLDANVARGTSLVPTKVLESILEAATLYSITFHSEHVENSQKLSRFVSTAFETFLQNVRSELLEQLLQASPKDWKHEMGGSTHEAEGGVDTKATEGVGEDQIESDEKAYEHITSATSLLVESVRQLASGLSLPEVAIDLDLASGLVDQAVGLSEAMVRKRVDQKFFNLRYRVIENCLAPFCLKVLKGPDGNEEKNDDGVDGIPVSEAIQMASVALSDSLQLVDDTIRSVLSRTNTIDPQESSSSLTSVEDASMLKMAVEQSSNRFCIWLAAALETLAGCESTKPGHIVDIKPDDANGDRAASYYSGFSASRETLGDDENELAESIEECMVELLDELDQYKTPSSRSNFALAVVEMCRLAQSSVSDDIVASIATQTGNMNKQRTAKAGLFATSSGGNTGENSNPTSDRFRLAASRVLNLYAISRGNEAAALLCSSLEGLSQEDLETATKPRSSACDLLAVVKSTSIECAELFGGPKRGGPIPENLEDEYASLTMARQQQTLRTAGLAFDVERMFAEKVVVYPHAFEYAEFDRNAVVSLVFKVALKEMLEISRHVRFSVPGYRQFLVDIEFLKFLLPHYVNNEPLADGSNPQTVLESLLADASACAKERCDGSAMLQDTSTEVNQARAAVRDFMDTEGNKDAPLSNFFIEDED